MKDLIKTLISTKPSYIESKILHRGIIITVDYLPCFTKLKLHFINGELSEILHADTFGGESILFGNSIETNHLIIHEFGLAVHEDVTNFINQLN